MLLGILVLALFYLLGKTSAGARPPPEPDAPPGFFDSFLGVAKAYKAPTAYQMAETYIYTTRGRGCPYPYYVDGPCYVLGNPDLDPETLHYFMQGGRG